LLDLIMEEWDESKVIESPADIDILDETGDENGN
jgi:hypothetical protein